MFFRTSVVAAALFVGSAVAADCTRSYTVQEGDYCDSISAAQKVSTYQLANLNQPAINTGCTNLVPGQVLCLATAEAEDCGTVHTVASGDSCASIAESYKTNSTVLWLNNPQIDEKCYNIYIGEVLCVGSDVKVPANAGATIAPNPTGVATSSRLAGSTAPPAAAAPTKAPTKAAAAATTKAPEPTYAADEDDEELPWCDEE